MSSGKASVGFMFPRDGLVLGPSPQDLVKETRHTSPRGERSMLTLSSAGDCRTAVNELPSEELEQNTITEVSVNLGSGGFSQALGPKLLNPWLGSIFGAGYFSPDNPCRGKYLAIIFLSLN